MSEVKIDEIPCIFPASREFRFSETGSLETASSCGESANHRFLSRGRAGCRPLQSALRLGGRRRNDLPCRVFLSYDECRTIRSNRARRFVSPLRMVSRSAPEENHVRYSRGVSARVNITSNDAIRQPVVDRQQTTEALRQEKRCQTRTR